MTIVIVASVDVFLTLAASHRLLPSVVTIALLHSASYASIDILSDAHEPLALYRGLRKDIFGGMAMREKELHRRCGIGGNRDGRWKRGRKWLEK
jgi:hypothetical protein